MEMGSEGLLHSTRTLMRYLDIGSAWLVCIIGVLHLAVGYAAFTAPTEGAIWFESAGFMLVVTGLANVAAHRGAGRMQHVAGLAGSGSILVLGGLIARTDKDLLTQPQTLTLLALGAILTVHRIRGMTTPSRQEGRSRIG